MEEVVESALETLRIILIDMGYSHEEIVKILDAVKDKGVPTILNLPMVLEEFGRPHDWKWIETAILMAEALEQARPTPRIPLKTKVEIREN